MPSDKPGQSLAPKTAMIRRVLTGPLQLSPNEQTLLARVVEIPDITSYRQARPQLYDISLSEWRDMGIDRLSDCRKRVTNSKRKQLRNH